MAFVLRYLKAITSVIFYVRKNLFFVFNLLNNFLNEIYQFLNKAKTKQNLIKLFSLIQICLIVLSTLKLSCYLTEDTVEIVCQNVIHSVDLLAEKLKNLIQESYVKEIAAEQNKIDAFLEKQNNKKKTLVKLLEWVPEYSTVINEIDEIMYATLRKLAFDGLCQTVFIALKNYFKG